MVHIVFYIYLILQHCVSTVVFNLCLPLFCLPFRVTVLCLYHSFLPPLRVVQVCYLCDVCVFQSASCLEGPSIQSIAHLYLFLDCWAFPRVGTSGILRFSLVMGSGLRPRVGAGRPRVVGFCDLECRKSIIVSTLDHRPCGAGPCCVGLLTCPGALRLCNLSLFGVPSVCLCACGGVGRFACVWCLCVRVLAFVCVRRMCYCQCVNCVHCVMRIMRTRFCSLCMCTV